MWLRLTVDHGHEKSWRSHIVQSRIFKCSFHHAKKAFHGSLKAHYGRVGRFASEEVVIKLVTSKWLPILLKGTEACPLFKSDVHSLDFVINRFFMKLFRTNNMLIINECREPFGFDLPSCLIARRTSGFLHTLKFSVEFVCFTMASLDDLFFLLVYFFVVCLSRISTFYGE